MPEYELLNLELKNLQNKVDQYIVHKMQWWRTEVTQKGCQHFIKTGNFEIDEHNLQQHIIERDSPKDKTLTRHYEDFLLHKQEQFNGSESIKDYKSLGVALQKYQDTNNVTLKFESINNADFFNRLRNWFGKNHNNNTTSKRIRNLKTFMLWAEKQELYNFKGYLYKYKVETYKPKYETLNRNEIQELQDLKIEKKNWQKIIDLFVCNCFMGMRISDLMTMEKGEFHQDDDGSYYYTKINEKTGEPILIEVTKTSLAILKKYDFQLPTYSSQYFNRKLQDILKHYDLFNTMIKKPYMQSEKHKVKKLLKREMITSHTARRTYITLSISNKVPLNTIKLATGHTQLSTLSGYANNIRNKEAVQAID
jgi:integrase